MDEVVDPIRLLSAAEHMAAHVRKEQERGHWSGGMPGVGSLAVSGRRRIVLSRQYDGLFHSFRRRRPVESRGEPPRADHPEFIVAVE